MRWILRSSWGASSCAAQTRARMVESGAPRPRQRALLALGACSGAVAFVGIQLMARLDTAGFLPDLPTGILLDVFPNPQWVLRGTVVLVCSMIIVFLCLPAYALPERDIGTLSGEGARTPVLRLPSLLRMHRMQSGPVAILAACVLYGYALVHAAHLDAGKAVFLCFILSLVLSAIVVQLFLPGPNVGRAAAPFARLTRGDALVIGALMLAIIALNLHDVRYWLYAFVGDEWAFYDAAAQIAHGAQVDLFSQSGVYGIHPVANSAYQALCMQLFGTTVTGWRMSAILSIAIPVLPLYWLGKYLRGAAFASIACTLYASCHLLWAFAHIGYNNNDALLSLVPGVAFLYAGLREDRPLFLFIAGLCAGLGWYTLFTGRLTVGILVLLVLVYWPGGWRAVLRRGIVLVIGFALTVLPLLVDNGLDIVRQMLPLISLSQARTAQPVQHLLAQNTARGIYAFVYATTNAHYVVGSVFDVLAASGLCVGFALALRALDDFSWRAVLIWFLVGVGLTTPLYYAPQVADTRMQAAIPAAALLAAFGICSVCSALASLGPTGWTRAIFGVGALALVGGSFALNTHRFYDEMPPQQQPTLIAMTIGALQRDATSMAVLGGAVSNNNLCQVLQGYGIDGMRAVAYNGGQLQVQCPDTARPLHPPAAPADVTVLLSDDGYRALSSCTLPFRVLLSAPNGQQHVWGYQFSFPPAPQVTYLGRLQQMLAQQCPSLATLPH